LLQGNALTSRSVHAYDGNTARLTIRTRYPATSKDSPTAVVSVQSMLETTKHELLEVGAWLNIIGYVSEDPIKAAGKETKRVKRNPRAVFVEAVMIWSAGAIKLDVYESAVKELQQTAAVIGATEQEPETKK
jgi:hypothetical protein